MATVTLRDRYAAELHDLMHVERQIVARRWRPASVPFAAAAGLLASYAVVITIGLPALERMKPTRRLARMRSGPVLLTHTTASAEDRRGTPR